MAESYQMSDILFQIQLMYLILKPTTVQKKSIFIDAWVATFYDPAGKKWPVGHRLGATDLDHVIIIFHFKMLAAMNQILVH